MMYWVWIIFVIILFELTILESVVLSISLNLEVSKYFSNIFFSTVPFFSFPSDTLMTGMLDFLSLSYRSLNLVNFFFLFIVHIRSFQLIYPKVQRLFFCHLHFAIERASVIFFLLFILFLCFKTVPC